MLHDPRDIKQTTNKIMHDYGIKCLTPNITKVYYDIETAVFGKGGVPEVHDRNAFITTIGYIVEYSNGMVTKYALVNGQMGYELETIDDDINVYRFDSEVQMCQDFFRRMNTIADDNNGVVICIGHNASANNRGDPYDLPWIANRSMYNLQVEKKVYRDSYSLTEGQNISHIKQFPRLYFLDTLRAVGQFLSMEKTKLASLSLDSLAKHFKLQGKAEDMSYHELAKISTQYGSEFGRAVSYCVQDCQVVRSLDQKLSLSETKIAFVEKCGVPLSFALNNTVAQNLSALI